MSRSKLSPCAVLTALSFVLPLAASAQEIRDLRAEWVRDANQSRIRLTWRGLSSGTHKFVITQRLGNHTTPAWTTISNPTITADPSDPTLWTTSTSNFSATAVRYYYFRVHRNANDDFPAEVAIIGNPSLDLTDLSYDRDADGIPDGVEQDLSTHTPNPFDLNDWADGTGDADGDGIPNAWEFHITTGTTTTKQAAMLDSSSVPAAHLTVNRAISTGGGNYHSISSALSNLPSVSGSGTNASTYRIILVSPGLYEENLSITTARNVAILPARTLDETHEFASNEDAYDSSERWEIRGTHTTNPVVSVNNSTLVLDGFILSRAAGSSGPIVSVTESDHPEERICMTRLVNCMIVNQNTGSSPAIRQYRSRLVVSHCTLFMNAAGAAATSTAYGIGPATGSLVLDTCSRLRVHNSIFWNPVNTTVPEVLTDGDFQFKSTMFHYREKEILPDQAHLLPGTLPMPEEIGLTPKGFQLTPNPIGETRLHVLRHMHGEWRGPVPVVNTDPITTTHWQTPPAPDLGAHQFWDDDEDGIPNFADRLINDTSNTDDDHDFDGLAELQEYQFGTDIQNADTQFLRVHQAVRMFVTQEQQTQFWRKGEVIRVAPAGDLSMGDFTSGPTPPAPVP